MENRDEILLTLGEIKGQLSGFLSTQSAHAERLDKLDERVSKLERWRAWFIGIATAAGAGAGSLGQFFSFK